MDNVTVESPEKLDGGRFDLSNTPDLITTTCNSCIKIKKSN